MDGHEETPFRRFWRQNRANLLVGLAVCLVLCLLAGIWGLLMPLPLWLALGAVCWLVRVGLVYRRWRSGNQAPRD